MTSPLPTHGIYQSMFRFYSRNGQEVEIIDRDSEGRALIKFDDGVRIWVTESEDLLPVEEKPGRKQVWITAWDITAAAPYSHFNWAFNRGTIADNYDALSKNTAKPYARLLTGEVPDDVNVSEYLLNHAGRRFASRDGWELLALTGELPEGMEDPYPDNTPEPEVYAEHRFPMLAAYCVVLFDHQAGDGYVVKDNYAGAVNLYQKHLDEMHNGTVHLLALTPPLGEDYPTWRQIVEVMAMQSFEAMDWSRWVHLNSYTRTPDEYVRMVKDGTHPIYPQK